MNLKTHMLVNDYKIGVMYIDGKEYISLTDLAKFADKDEDLIFHLEGTLRRLVRRHTMMKL